MTWDAQRPLPVADDHPALTKQHAKCPRPQTTVPSAREPSSSRRRIDVDVNFYRVFVDPLGPTEYFRYDISIIRRRWQDPNAPPSQAQGRPDGAQPRPVPKHAMRAIVGELQQQHSDVFGCARAVYDGVATMYAPRKLGDWTNRTFERVTALDDRRQAEYDVTVREVDVVDVSDLWAHVHQPHKATNAMKALQALDIVFNHMASMRMVATGRNYYSMANPRVIPGEKEICHGYHQTVRLGSPYLFLNIDPVVSTFYARQRLLNYVLTTMRLRDVNALQSLPIRQWRRSVIKLEVSTTHRSQERHTVFDVGEYGADQTMIFDRGGVAVETVAAYFARRYCITLRYPDLAVINRISHGPPQLILVVLSARGGVYNEIKRASDSHLGIPTQCVMGNKIERARGQYCENVALKINQKLNGVNLIIRRPLSFMTRSSTIVFGADIDEPRNRRAAGITAVVASMDPSAAQYVGRATVRTVLMDSFNRMPMLVRDLFLEFYRHTGTKPASVVYFRNGVNDGEIDSMYHSEMCAITKAWLMLSASDPLPAITFIRVTRHHHLRAFPISSHDGDRSGNLPAGTVIDDKVVDARAFSFFLFGHSGLLGTSRPAHYTVLANENRWRPQDIHQLCFDLCHMFGRSTRSVSVVAPIYYAKILAERARCLLDYRTDTGEHIDTASTDSDASGSDRSSAFGGLPGNPVVDVHDDVVNTLFFV
ncbi:hypothetical protein Poli38472_000306 [Pythium oligandrum]|uniref:Piwi domain-containing protein n=1 Tax=Pythium oligandrum TaxID=41045 RepID=A0A8K1CBE4_PYTOL|nr:hypothetical protein Poli38472_000306 [Pythium oligandrum]|eukprot:TMW60264.1 hypothetical protein Poli38472_000306 [Pythium oligandrum]